jgi:hypothetical protein
MNSTKLALCLLALCFASSARGADEAPTVGMPARLTVVLPGPELEAKPIDDRKAPVVVRIIRVEAVEDGFRYDLEYTGMVPGRFDLRDSLRRKDRSAAKGLPPIRVTVHSVLPPGKATPNELDPTASPRLGGYKMALIGGGVLWALGLVALFIVGRRRRRVAAAARKPRTLADHLRPLVEEALAGRAAPARLADLERSLITYWSRKLGLAGERPADALPELRRHAEAGPLLVQLESWLHRPARAGKIDVAALLEPYRELPADALEAEVRP